MRELSRGRALDRQWLTVLKIPCSGQDRKREGAIERMRVLDTCIPGACVSHLILIDGCPCQIERPVGAETNYICNFGVHLEYRVPRGGYAA
jgi:hypothetical protein